MSNRRIVLDANVLIDAIFVPGSFSYKLLFTPAGNAVHSSFIICKSVVDETERRLKAAEPKVGIQPRNFLADVLRLRGYVIVDALSVGRSRNVGINRADSYVVDDALALNADICTKDIGDIGGASVLGIRVFTPRDLLGVGLHTLSGGFYAGRASGTWIFFGSFSQPFSPAAGETSKRYLADLPGVGGLFIDSAKGEICFALDWGPAVSLKIPPNATDISLCVTYRANAKLTIQYGVNGPESNISIGHPAQGAVSSSVSIGNNRLGLEQANLCIRDCSALSAYLPSKKARNNMLKGEASTSELERLSVEDAISIFGLSANVYK